MGGHLDWDAGIKTNMAGQHVGVETGLDHAAGDNCADFLGRNSRAAKQFAGDLDADIDG